MQLFDQAGVVTTEDYDFKGNLLCTRRQLARRYDTTIDWSSEVPLEDNAFVSRTRYDALDRAIELTAPDDSVIRPRYNEANLLERVDAVLRGARHDGEPRWTTFVGDLDYDARGQRTSVRFGNGVRVRYAYDPLTARLAQSRASRNASAFPGDCPRPAPNGWRGCRLQNLHYVYDAVGNITHVRDDAQQTILFRNRRVEPSNDFTYDAAYRLIEATGREHVGQAGGPPLPHSYNDASRIALPHPGDGNAMATYVERYAYDLLGNIERMNHRGTDPGHAGWTRVFDYDEASLLEPDVSGNRLSRTSIGGASEKYSDGDGYDANGNPLRMPQLHRMQWDYRDQLRMSQRQAVNGDDAPGARHQGECTWYVYDGSGHRARKVTERAARAGCDAARRTERIYIAGFEVYREYEADGEAIALQRESLHLTDDKQRIATTETRTKGEERDVPARLIRYRLADHVGSTRLELDERARIVSYEEYTPYGSTTYQATRNQTEAPNRYRFTGMERDEESGLNYHTSRYYAPWLARWISPDPLGIEDGLNVYRYVKANPVGNVDRSGRDTKQQVWEREFEEEIPQYKNIGSVVGTRDDGEMTPMGVRVPLYRGDYLSARPFYERKEAAMLAYQGFIHYAELVEAGHDAAALHLACARYRNCAPIRDDELDLAGYAHWSQRSVAARNGVILLVGILGVQQAFAAALEARALAVAEEQSLARATATQINYKEIEGVTRTLTTATGDETFIHTTANVSMPHTAESAAVNIVETRSLNLSTPGPSGQWGEGGYAYEGTLGADTAAGALPKVQFSVPKGTAIETITVPGKTPIIRLVPPQGNTLPLVNPVSNLSAADAAAGAEWLAGLRAAGFL